MSQQTPAITDPSNTPTPATRGATVREWTKLIAITGSAQVAVQAIGFVCGILVIRLLPVEEYAFYTIANTMLGTMTLLADGGIASGVMSQGGKVWRDKKKLGAVLATGMKLRRQFAVWSLAVSVPILYYLLMKQGASWITATMIALSLLPAFFSALSAKLLEISAKLHQDVSALQIIQVTSNALRLALSGLMLFVFPFAALAIVASGASQIYGNWRLRGVSGKFADCSAGGDPQVRREILGIVKRVLPGAIYYTFSGQLTIWLISFFGSSESVAEVGALSRLSQVLSLFTAVFLLLFVPRYARIPRSSHLVVPRFLQLQAILFAFLGLTVSLASMFPHQILWILGDSYISLRKELVIMIGVDCLALIAGCSYSLNISRNHIVPPLFAILFSVSVQALAIFNQDLSSTSGVLWVGVYSAAAQALLHIVYMLAVVRE